MTRKIAERGAATAPPGTVGAAAADQYSQHFSVVLDNQVVTQPIINFVENPQGIDGRPAPRSPATSRSARRRTLRTS